LKNLKTTLGFVGFLGLTALAGTAAMAQSEGPEFSYQNESACRVEAQTITRPTGPFVVVGDTQRTAGVERLFLRKELNEDEQRLLLPSIARQNPAFVALIGDLTFDSEKDANWDYFDDIMRPICNRHIPVLPALGNHDYWGRNFDVGLSKVFRRFPFLKFSRWYAKHHGPLGIIWLDTNFKKMGEDMWNRQMAWYRDVLHAMDRDPRTKGILVFTHHPPYTNSTYYDPPVTITSGLLVPFFATRKSLAMISGHVHGYERFEDNGRSFIVSGGGGGPRAKNLLNGNEARHKDLFHGSTPRPFNYVIVDSDTRDVKLKVIGLDKGTKVLKQIDGVTMSFAD
jgi:hypothetical protein